MPLDEPVDMRRQMVYTMIPVLDLYAAYRVGRLRLMLLIYAVFLAMVVPFYAAGFDECEDYWLYIYLLVLETGALAVTVYLMYGWSEDWNRRQAAPSGALRR